MDSNLSNKAKAGTRAQRKTRTKNRGSQTCSSSDDDFHSDDNLRPYEEVKVAYHDKKLTGLGLTPDEHAVSPLVPSSAVGPPLPPGPSSSASISTRACLAYSYGSDDEGDTLAARSAPLLAQGRAPMQHDRVVYDPPWDQKNFEQIRHRPPHATSESDEDNRHAQLRYSHSGTVTLHLSGHISHLSPERIIHRHVVVHSPAIPMSQRDLTEPHGRPLALSPGTLPMPPPTFPPPPPPPIQDIPQRSPAPHRQHSFGPSMRGNYTDSDFRRQQPFSDGEVEVENPYMVQNNPGSAFTTAGDVGPRFPRTVPRSGSVPSCRGQPMDIGSLHSQGYNSDTYPYHCPNEANHAAMLASSVDSENKPTCSYNIFLPCRLRWTQMAAVDYSPGLSLMEDLPRRRSVSFQAESSEGGKHESCRQHVGGGPRAAESPAPEGKGQIGCPGF
ncbi:hypothetical protein C0Q70_06264 [Pomacea canaliculata]|uniref:Uncharacterized protein n=1 Tax=Pomacea canaliculata TaxID=400727 RepID=A0A2T7PNI2_POMCA|nr:hypothetical protein C0Q70_06264 [Pomacea canaliculata]